MDRLSPISRRIVALAFLFLLAISMLNLFIVPLVQMTEESLEDLADSRLREERISGAATGKAPPAGDAVPVDLLLVASDEGAAFVNLSSRIAGAASGNQVKIESIGPGAGGYKTRITADFLASGVETSLVKMMADLERGAPRVRLARWSISAPDAPGAAAKLEARAIALWISRP